MTVVLALLIMGSVFVAALLVALAIDRATERVLAALREAPSRVPEAPAAPVTDGRWERLPYPIHQTGHCGHYPITHRHSTGVMACAACAMKEGPA